MRRWTFGPRNPLPRSRSRDQDIYFALAESASPAVLTSVAMTEVRQRIVDRLELERLEMAVRDPFLLTALTASPHPDEYERITLIRDTARYWAVPISTLAALLTQTGDTQ